jgi:sortase (surface protein transpeptidase)
VASLLAIAAVGLAWVAWPDGTPRADLVEAEPAPAPPRPPSTSSSTTTTVPPPTTTVPPRVVPARLQIPAIGLDAAVVPVGLDQDGAMEIPPPADAGWYELGPSPGESGSAVLAAHIDFNGRPGAFFHLRSLPVGAEVVVLGEDGIGRTFTVATREQVPKDQIDLGRYFTGTGPPRLSLITCGGAFDGGAGHYQDNIVVTATPTG